MKAEGIFTRRALVKGGATLAGVGLLGVPELPAFAAGGKAAARTVPLDLLSRTFPPQMLAKSLISARDWRPLPKREERAAWDAVPADVRRSVVERAENVPKVPPVYTASAFLNFQKTGDRYPFDEDVIFQRRKRLNILVVAECIEAKGRFVSQIGDMVWAICEESFWGIPAHVRRQSAGEGLIDPVEMTIELYTGETAMNLAWARYLVGEELDKISPMFRKRIVHEIERRLLVPGLASDDYWWMGIGPAAQRVNNWNPWICSNWMTSVLLVEEDRAKRLASVTKILKCIDQYVNQYPADAGEEEGPGYWSKSPACYFECASALVSATGGTSKVLENPFLRSMGEYIVNAHISDRQYTDYGDALRWLNPSGALLYKFGKATGSTALMEFGPYVATHYGPAVEGEAGAVTLPDAQDAGRLLTDVLLAGELRAAKQTDALVRDVWYPGLGLMAAREQAGSTKGFYVAVQTSNNGRSHGHMDSGSFLVYHDGDPVFIDLGSATYTKATFGKDRNTLWSVRSAFHNLPLVGGVEQAQGGKMRATNLRYSATDARAQLTCDLATAYPAEAGIKRWERTVALDRGAGGVVRFEEEFALTKAAPVVLHMMTPRAPDVSNHGVLRLASNASGKKAVVMRFDPTQLDATVEKIVLHDASLERSWGPVMYRVALSSRGAVTAATWTMEIRAEG